MKSININDLEKKILELNKAKDKLSDIQNILSKMEYARGPHELKIGDDEYDIYTNNLIYLDNLDVEDILLFLETKYKKKIEDIKKELNGYVIE